MRKQKFRHLLLFNLLTILWVPTIAPAAFDAPPPKPVAFALANLACFPDYLVASNVLRHPVFIEVGGARLYGMPEIQPFNVRAGAPLWGGFGRLSGSGMASGAYGEYAVGVGYGRILGGSVATQMDIHLLQVSIDDYGSAHSYQIDARIAWRVQPSVQMALAWYNLSHAHIGSGSYPLPQRFALGGRLGPVEDLDLFIEVEKDTRYPPAVRIALGYHASSALQLLFGFQSNPDILATGLSFRISSYRASAAYQYHPDLGFSQCYGLTITF
jgi:hypothetical protein